MSDFLSNFTNDNYENKQAKKKQSQASDSHKERDESEITSNEDDYRTDEQTSKPTNSSDKATADTSKSRMTNHKKSKKEKLKDNESQPFFDEETQTMTDPSYKKRQLRKKIILIASSIVAIALVSFGYYRLTTVKVPNFVGKQISEVRDWGVETGVKINPEQVYDFEAEINDVIKQNQTPGKRMKKKQKLVVYTSLGPDPKQIIKLPEFKEMTYDQAEEWMAEQKAENVTIQQEYSDKVKKDQLIKQEFSHKDFDSSKYKREDQMILTYSKGKEVFEKNISMPNFVKKDKSKVDEWVKANQIDATIKWVDAESTKGKVLTQSVEAKTKVAKRDKITFTISKGKAIIVPNFADFNKNNIEEVTGLTVQVKEQFSDAIGFGGLISQSVEAGKKYYEGDDIPIVNVVYSAGKPYLRSYIGELEGDLAERFFDDYRSKGANITYTTYRTPSSEPKGTVVKMSTYNEFVSTDFSVSIGISDGSQASELPQAENQNDEDHSSLDDDLEE